MLRGSLGQHVGGGVHVLPQLRRGLRNGLCIHGELVRGVGAVEALWEGNYIGPPLGSLRYQTLGLCQVLHLVLPTQHLQQCQLTHTRWGWSTCHGQ
jgi:hypothetical protein